MGSVICKESSPGVARPGSQTIPCIFGDYFDRDTRMILAAMNVSGDLNKTFHEIDSLNDDSLTGTEYFQVNPTGKVPTLVEGSFKVLGGDGALSILFYLVNTHDKIGKTLFTRDDKEMITKYLTWYVQKFRIQSDRLIELYKQEILKGSNETLTQKITEERKSLWPVFNTLDSRLVKSNTTFLCTNKDKTLADIVYYIEINTILQMTQRDLPEDCKKLQHWYRVSMNDPSLQALNKQFAQALAVKRH